MNRVLLSMGAFVALATALVAQSAAALEGAATSDASKALPEGTDPEGALDRIVPAEIARIFTKIASETEPAHWMAVGVVDRTSLDVEATHGAAGPVHRSRVRLADLDLRVGTPALDNTHKIRDAGWFDDEPRPGLDMPLGDNVPWAIQTAIWRTADDAYRSGVRRLIKVRTNDVVKVSREDLSADFSPAPVAHHDEPGMPLVVDGDAWQQRVRAASKIFLEYPAVFDSNVSLRAQDDLDQVWTSEGSAVTWRRHSVRVATWASTVADDGMQLDVYDYVDARTIDAMPSDAELEHMVRGVAERVTELRQAPLVEPYVGPAILRGRAAAVFFHEIFGHRVEGHRQKDEDEGQTFTDKVGQVILPTFLSVYDDPTRAKWGDVDLAGSYPYDDEGVAATRALLVDKGVLRGFLLSRSPIKGFEHSNGHGRRQPGNAVVARQGNLIVEASRTVSYDDLRAQLVNEVKRQNKPFGLVFDDISGGFTFTGRATPNAFTVKPVTVWRVFADGRPDELVRGVDMIGTPLTTFSRILAASDRVDVFNGVCGAESGWVPVAAVAPDLLVSEVEVQRKEKERRSPASPRSTRRTGSGQGELMLWLLAALRSEAAPTGALMDAAEAELARATASLRLPNQPKPYFLSYEVIDGDVATTSASFGAIESSNHEPYRNLRVEVRVGDYSFDSGNFAGSFGTRDGVEARGLPTDDDVLALRREMWLATDEAFKGATEQLSAKHSAREGDPRVHAPDFAAVDPLVTEPIPERRAQSEKIEAIAVALSDELRIAGPSLEEATTAARDWQGVRMLCTSEGTRAWTPTGFTVIRVEASARATDGARIRDGRSWIAKTPDALPPLEEMRAEVRAMAAWLEALREAPVEDDYLGPVLFEDPAAMELFRQLAAPEIAGTPAPEQGRDALSDGERPPVARIGRRLLPEGWSVVDDPAAHLDAAGGYAYDFEGVPAARVELVEDGVVRTVLMSRVPREDLVGSNGHGRSLGTARRDALPGVVVVEPAREVGTNRLRKRALRMARQAGRDYVLVVRRIEPPAVSEQFDVAFTGDAPLSGLTAPYETYRLYTNGKEIPVRGLGFLGVDRRALRDIVLAGKVGEPVGEMDSTPGPQQYTIGPVGGLPVTWSTPPVLIAEMELRGSTIAEPRIIPPPPRDAPLASTP